MMSPLEIIKDAYDRAGIGYVVREREGYFYLVRCDPGDKEEKMNENFHEFLRREFMEFDEKGEVASY